MSGTANRAADAIRIWRLRKRSLYVDAELRAVGASGEFDLSIFYGTMLTWSGRFPTRSAAVDEARARRSLLEREGWTFHW